MERMHGTSKIAFLVISALFIACGKGEFITGGHALFLADGATVRYAVLGGEGTPRFHSIRSLRGLPGDESPEVIDVTAAGREECVVITRKHGVYRVAVSGGAYRRIDRGLPPEVIYPYDATGITKPVVSISSTSGAGRIALIVPTEAYYSDNGGRTFSRMPLAGVKRYTELTSIALHPKNDRLVVVGTSSNGIYVSQDGGTTARRIRAGMPGEPAGSPNFLEEVRALCFGGDEDTFYAGLGNGGGVYRGSIARGNVMPVRAPGLITYPDGDFYRVTSLNYLDGALLIGTNRGWRKIIETAETKKPGAAARQIREAFRDGEGLCAADSGGMHFSFPPEYRPRREFEPDRRAMGKQAMYISYSFTQGGNYARLLKLLRYLRLNAVVINLKDDYGTIRVPVSDPLVKKVPGSVRPYVNVLETIKRLRADGIYVIARQVCFKDDKVYDFLGGKYAVKNPAGRPFRKGPEKWVDGFSEFVWDYNIAVARELEKAGADEVQFDYIRFPDVRGEADNRRFDFKKEHQTMREALVSFLKKARASLDVPISVDLFGYTAIYQWGDWIGQDMSELTRYVDVVSPMFYPSHYTGGYAAGYGDRRIYYTIYLSCKRAIELSGGAHLRPYIQAFYYKDNSDNYCVDYIGWELDGLRDSGVKDYIFWNDLSEYTILLRGVRKYRGMGEGPVPPEIKACVPKKLPFSTMVEREGPS